MEDRERLPVVDNIHNSMQVRRLHQIPKSEDWFYNRRQHHRSNLFKYCPPLLSASTTSMKKYTLHQEGWGQRSACSSTTSRTTSFVIWTTRVEIWTIREVCRVRLVPTLHWNMKGLTVHCYLDVLLLIFHDIIKANDLYLLLLFMPLLLFSICQAWAGFLVISLPNNNLTISRPEHSVKTQ